MSTTTLRQAKILTQDDKVIINSRWLARLLQGLSIGKRKKNQLKTNWKEIEKYAGIWKDKPIDGLEYQKQIRAEWDDRDLLIQE